MAASETLNSVTLSEAVTAGAQEWKLSSVEGLTPGLRLYVDKELAGVVKVGVSGLVKVQRGLDGTGATAHASGLDVLVGRPDQFFSGDPLGQPAVVVPVMPYVNVTTGQIWLNQGDQSGQNRWWEVVPTTFAIDALGIRRQTRIVSIPAGSEVAQAPPGSGVRPVSNYPAALSSNLIHPFTNATQLARKAALIDLKGAANKRILTRTELRWSTIQPNSSADANWTNWDLLINWFHDNNVQPWIQIGNTPDWAGAGGSDGPPSLAHLADFTHFCELVAQRYGPGGSVVSGFGDGFAVTRMQIYNEPNLNTHIAAGWTAEKAAGVMIAAYPVIKAVSSDIEVIMPGLAVANGPAGNYMAGLYSFGILSFFDHAALHPYSGGDLGAATTLIQNIRNKMTVAGDTRPIAITEWGVSFGGKTNPVQANAVTALFNSSMPQWASTLNVSYVIWYSLSDIQSELYGLMQDEDLTNPAESFYRKLSYYAFRNDLLLY